MSRALLVLANDIVRERAINWIRKLPKDTRVEFKAPKRSLDQNSLMWVLLGHVAAQKEHCGRKYNSDQWKCIFMHACGQEVQFIPSLDGSTFIPWGNRSSDLSVGEMTELIEYILSWGAQNGVEFGDEARAA
jgi:hypothetical protein